MQGSFNQIMVKFVLISNFHKKVRATVGLITTSQLQQWCYIQLKQTIWEQNGLIERPNSRKYPAKNLRHKRPENLCIFYLKLNDPLPQLSQSAIFLHNNIPEICCLQTHPTQLRQLSAFFRWYAPDQKKKCIFLADTSVFTKLHLVMKYQYKYHLPPNLYTLLNMKYSSKLQLLLQMLCCS